MVALAGVGAANTIFTLATNSTSGVVTLTQFAQIDHVPNNDTSAPYDDQFAILNTGLVTLSGTATITFSGIKDSAGNTVPDGANVAVTAVSCGTRNINGGCISSTGGAIAGGTVYRIASRHRPRQ